MSEVSADTALASSAPASSFYEDFEVGAIYRHARGKTVTEMDNVLLTNLVMNTAEGHFNEHRMASEAHGIFAQRVVFGGINLSMVIGLAAEDTAQNAIAEIGLDGVRLSNPVFHGDTLYAFTEVLAKEDGEQVDAGLVTFKHYGINQDDKLCVEVTRTALIRRRGA